VLDEEAKMFVISNRACALEFDEGIVGIYYVAAVLRLLQAHYIEFF